VPVALIDDEVSFAAEDSEDLFGFADGSDQAPALGSALVEGILKFLRIQGAAEEAGGDGLDHVLFHQVLLLSELGGVQPPLYPMGWDNYGVRVLSLSPGGGAAKFGC